MTNLDVGNPQDFVTTKSYRRFREMCDACRRAHVVGLGYGPPGTGKTESAKQYAQWKLFKPFLPESLIPFTGRSAMDGMYPYRPFIFASAPLDTSIQECRTVFYMRAPQLYSRVGFAHEMEPLSDDETRDFLEKRWSHRVKPSSDDFTDREAVATILRIT